jgi:tetratricopeptide (TPR) repeat protein
MVWAVVQGIRVRTEQRKVYLFSLISFMLGGVFDLLATLRDPTYMTNYAVYSVSFYMLGLVILFAEALRALKSFEHGRIQKISFAVLTIFFVVHLVPVPGELYAKGQKTLADRSSRDYEFIFDHCLWQSHFFWRKVERHFYDDQSFAEVRNAGRRFSWGADHEDIRNYIQTHDETYKQVTLEDKTGDVGNLIVSYTQNIKFKTYLYGNLMMLAEKLTREGKVDEAIENYGNAMILLPNVPEAYHKRGMTYYKTHQYDKSLADLRKAQRLGFNVGTEILKELELK